ncbi:MAG: translation initiation factor IF-2 [Dehalococcoidia bacterium]|nr:MAG: translation initiation factor IF-2 [Dehalococcoidia bacterium]
MARFTPRSNRNRTQARPHRKTAPRTDARPESVVQAPRRADGARGSVPQVEITSASLSVKQLSELLDVDVARTVKQLMRRGMMANVNDVIDFETAVRVAQDLGFQVIRRKQQSTEKSRKPVQGENFVLRPPVVTVMGHVDHGKTTLLDTIRNTNVTAREAGAITQHIGAYQSVLGDRKITFLDTPGHRAFTAMRARGANATDIVVLVVAADDGVMPQTREAIDHANAAGVPIVVAINKIDKPEANVDRTKQLLTDAGLVIEEWGGDVVCVPLSAKTGAGVPELLENLFLVADVADLRADPTGSAEGIVIEARLDKLRGTLASLLVQRGTLRLGDSVVAGTTWGKVKAMFNDRGERITSADPSTPVEILGLSGVPLAGELFTVAADDKVARSVAEAHQQAAAPTPLSLSSLSSQIGEGQIKELSIVLKTDVQGSIEPIRSVIERLGNDEVKPKVVLAASGAVTENDILLAAAHKGIVIAFNAKAAPGAEQVAEQEGVAIQRYDIIYRLEEDIEAALKGMLKPTFVETLAGRAEVRAIFPGGKQGKVAGLLVREGRLWKGAWKVRVVRGGEVVSEPQITSIRRFKDTVNEVSAGLECGIGLLPFGDTQIGDIIELYRREKAT